MNKKISKIFSFMFIILILLSPIGIGKDILNYSIEYSGEELKKQDNLYIFHNSFFEKFTLYNKLILFIKEIIDSKFIHGKKDNLNKSLYPT